MISLKPDNIYGTWEVTTDMSSLNYGSLDSLVGAMDQAAGYMRGQTSGEAIDSMEKYVDKYQGLEDQARNSQSKSTWIIRPGKNKDSVEIECDSGGQTTYLDGTFNEKHDKLELKTSKASMNYTGSDGTTYDLEKYGLYTTGTVSISIGKNEKTGKASMKFEGEQQMKSQFANFKAGITGMKISNDY